MNPFLQDAPRLLRGQTFDQVWAEVFVNPHLTDEICEWMASVAPVRLGLCAESTEYTEEEFQIKPEMATKAVRFRKRVPYLTHLALGDENDPQRLASSELATTWWLVSANFSLIASTPQPEIFTARFHGHIYGERKAWLHDPTLTDLFDAAPHAETSRFVVAFDIWRLLWRVAQRFQPEKSAGFLGSYMKGSRKLRLRAAYGWQWHLRQTSAIISLPLIFKSFPGRVTEGMAAVRPVVCWKVPGCPRMLEVFEPGKEILLYSTVDELRAHLESLAQDKELAESIAKNALHCLLARHTTEVRVSQLLHWIETGEEPNYQSGPCSS